MVSFTHASKGKIFMLTDAGNKIGRVKAKFMPLNPMFKESYLHTAPTAWIKNGWIEEKEINYGKQT